jgi:hypothetical protein
LKNFLFLITLCLLNCQIQAAEIKPSTTTVNQCYATDEAVFMLVGTRWLGAEAMHITTEGMFVMEGGEWLSLEDAIKCDNFWTWTCRVCGTTNVQGNFTCMKCGASR